MNNTILTDNKEIETLDLPSWWSDDFPCVAPCSRPVQGAPSVVRS